jgi:hypothetical protein
VAGPAAPAGTGKRRAARLVADREWQPGDRIGRQAGSRAQAFLADGQIVSRVAGGRAVLARGSAPADLVRRSLDQQRGAVPERAAAPDAIRYANWGDPGIAGGPRPSEQRKPGGRPRRAAAGRCGALTRMDETAGAQDLEVR